MNHAMPITSTLFIDQNLFITIAFSPACIAMAFSGNLHKTDWPSWPASNPELDLLLGM
jgi:hypothetical protein